MADPLYLSLWYSSFEEPEALTYMLSVLRRTNQTTQAGKRISRVRANGSLAGSNQNGGALWEELSGRR